MQQKNSTYEERGKQFKWEKYEKYDQPIPYKIEVDDYSFHFAHKRECEIKFYVQSVDDVIGIPFSFVVRKQSYELLNVFSECLL